MINFDANVLYSNANIIIYMNNSLVQYTKNK